MKSSFLLVSLLVLLISLPTLSAQLLPTTPSPISVSVTIKSSGDPFFGVGYPFEFTLNGLHAPNLTLYIGVQYNFSIDTTDSHPWYIGTDPTGQFAGFLYGGITLGDFSWTPSAADAAQPHLYYQCENHANMGNAIFLVNAPSTTVSSSAAPHVSSSPRVSSSAASSSSAPSPPVNSIGPGTTSLSVTVTAKVAGDPFFGVGYPFEYVVNGLHAPTLTLYIGRTYNFSLATTASHPFYIGTDPTGQGVGVLYGGQFSGTFLYTPSATDAALPALYYQCENHANMGNAITLVSQPAGSSTAALPPISSSTAASIARLSSSTTPSVSSSTGSSIPSIGPTVTSLSVTTASKQAGDEFFGVGFPALFVINGLRAPTLTVYRGVTYNFTLNTGAIHPWYIGTDPNGAGAGHLYSGQSTGTFSWTPSASDQALPAIYYECENHDNLGNSITVIDPPSSPSSSSAAPAIAPSSSPVASTPGVSASLCVLLYSLPGTVDYPWSAAYNLQVTYNPTPVPAPFGQALALLGGNGTRVFTNRFGASTTSTLTLSSTASPLLLLNSTSPFTSTGLTFTASPSVQLPGYDVLTLNASLSLSAQGGIIAGDGALLDPIGQAVLAPSIPGFFTSTIGASNVNSLAAQYRTCQAPITFTNGLRAPTQPSASNGGLHPRYSYFISDGLTYSVVVNLTLTTASAFATTADALGNPYQTVINATGTRIYTHLPTGLTQTSTVRLASGVGRVVSQRLYPYALLVSSPGVYSVNTAPFLDVDGLGLSVSPAVVVNGQPVGSAVTVGVLSVGALVNATAGTVRLAEFIPGGAAPVLALQQQTYFIA